MTFSFVPKVRRHSGGEDNHKLASNEATQHWEINMQDENEEKFILISSQGESLSHCVDKCQGQSLINGQIFSHNCDAAQLVKK